MASGALRIVLWGVFAVLAGSASAQSVPVPDLCSGGNLKMTCARQCCGEAWCPPDCAATCVTKCIKQCEDPGQRPAFLRDLSIFQIECNYPAGARKRLPER